nr:hypothetical protein [Tanacetum cinerariifolium]
MRKKKKKKKHSVESNKDVALEETINATAAYAQEQLCKVGEALAVLDFNRVLVTKPHNKSLYELLHGRTPSIGFMRPFGCPVTILNTLDSLGKFDRKVDEGFLVGYYISSKAFRVFNSRNRIIQETLHVNFLENKPIVTEKAREEIDQQYVLFLVWSSGFSNPQNNDGDAAFDGKEHDFDAKKPESEVNVSPRSCGQTRKQDDKTKKEAKGKSHVESLTRYRDLNTNDAGPSNVAASPTYGRSSFIDASQLPDDPDMLELEDIIYFDDDDDVGTEANFNNLETSITVSPILTIRVYKDHPVSQIIGDLSLTTQTRSMIRMAKDQGRLSQMFDDDFYTVCFLAFFHKRNPRGDKKDERGIVTRNKARLVAQGHTQEEEINYKEVFAPIARIKAIGLFLAYASFIGFMVYQMDALYDLHQAPRAWYETLKNYILENGFQRSKIDQTLFIKKQKGDILLVQIYADDIIFGATNKDLCKAFTKLMKDKFQVSSMGELTFFLGLQVKQKKDGIFISQDKYVAEILRKFGLNERKSASTPIDTDKPLLKDHNGEDMDVHTYRSMIGSLMYLTSSRPDIIFAVCACERFQVTPKALHLHAVKKIFGYLKSKPHLGLWYPKCLPFDLVAYSDSDYAGVSLDRKSTTRGCQSLGCRLISWQCKKQTVVATSVTPKALHLHAVKKIFGYLKSKPHFGLWYPKCLPFDLVAYSDSDYAGASLDRKSLGSARSKQLLPLHPQRLNM